MNKQITEALEWIEDDRYHGEIYDKLEVLAKAFRTLHDCVKATLTKMRGQGSLARMGDRIYGCTAMVRILP